MAKFVLTRNWIQLPVSNGTIENDSIGKIEIAPLSEDHGLILYPKEKYQFGVTVKARSVIYNEVTVNVVAITQTVPSSEDAGTASSEDIDSLFTRGTSSGSQQSGGQSAGSDDSNEASKTDIDSLFNF